MKERLLHLSRKDIFANMIGHYVGLGSKNENNIYNLFKNLNISNENVQLFLQKNYNESKNDNSEEFIKNI